MSEPTQPPQGSEVEREAILKQEHGRDGTPHLRAAQIDPGPIWLEVGRTVVPRDDYAALQAQLQRVEEERRQAELRADRLTHIRFELKKCLAQTEARIHQAAKDFEGWAEEEKSRIPGAKSKQEQEVHRGIALTAKRAAEHLRSQSSSEVGEGQEEAPLDKRPCTCTGEPETAWYRQDPDCPWHGIPAGLNSSRGERS